MGRKPSYSDEALAEALASSRSWRGVLRALGLNATSASAMRSVRGHAERLGLDYTHFTGQRRWTDQALADAVQKARTWSDVAETLGLAGGSSTTTLKGHAVRLGLDTGHLTARPHGVRPDPTVMVPDMTRLARSGSLLAASWFSLCGYDVAWPLEPARYDLLVTRERTERIQVKTSTVRSRGTWTVWLSTTGAERRPYDPDEIDSFFIIDGDLGFHLVPVAVVGGMHAIQLAAYHEYRVGSFR